MVVDYRSINLLTVVDKYHLPSIDEILDRVGNASYFFKLDLHSGFHQIRVHPDHVDMISTQARKRDSLPDVLPRDVGDKGEGSHETVSCHIP